MDDVRLRASGITKHVGGIAAKRGVDLAPRPGAIYVLMGEQGATVMTGSGSRTDAGARLQKVRGRGHRPDRPHQHLKHLAD